MRLDIDRDNISIHAPREGSDICDFTALPFEDEFQSTLPVRGATKTSLRGNRPQGFQSTLPVRGATVLMLLLSSPYFYFNPRSP